MLGSRICDGIFGFLALGNDSIKIKLSNDLVMHRVQLNIMIFTTFRLVCSFLQSQAGLLEWVMIWRLFLINACEHLAISIHSRLTHVDVSVGLDGECVGSSGAQNRLLHFWIAIFLRWGLVVDILEELLYLILDSLLIFKIYQFRCSILCAFSLDFLFLKLFLELVFEIL